uniref:Reverse transcriptase zinc-binding domain-containing protein n=1 Tax=Ananas comosus var. bracteatus TaxID=296719 RepID=A0A6V7PFD5_ANACO|nr:unnamed protein product [Ananas comosus var. bracteatus]
MTACISALKARLSSLKTGLGPDSVHWRWSPDGRFTVKSTYSALCDGGTRDGGTCKIWKLCIPLKVKVFCWLVLKKRPLSADNLLKRGWIGNTNCVLCGSDAEIVDHIFSQCVFFKFLVVMSLEESKQEIWAKMCVWFGTDGVEGRGHSP